MGYIKRLLNIGFIFWVLFMLFVLVPWVIGGVDDPHVYWNFVMKKALYGLIFPITNYILFKKMTFWNADWREDK